MPLVTAFSLGFLYFISAIPTAFLSGAPLWAAAVVAWCGYAMGGIVIVMLGVPLRIWLTKKFKIDPYPDQKKLFWRIWKCYGVFGLGLIAPITIGPQVGTLLLLALGENPKKIVYSISLGAIPWALIISVLTKWGHHALTSSFF